MNRLATSTAVKMSARCECARRLKFQAYWGECFRHGELLKSASSFQLTERYFSMRPRRAKRSAWRSRGRESHARITRKCARQPSTLPSSASLLRCPIVLRLCRFDTNKGGSVSSQCEAVSAASLRSLGGIHHVSAYRRSFTMPTVATVSIRFTGYTCR